MWRFVWKLESPRMDSICSVLEILKLDYLFLFSFGGCTQESLPPPKKKNWCATPPPEMDLVDAFQPSLGDDYFLEIAVIGAETDELVRVYFNTLTKIQRKVAEFGGPQGWKILPCGHNHAGCKSVVFEKEISPAALEGVCEQFSLGILELERMPPATPEDMTMLIKKT